MNQDFFNTLFNCAEDDKSDLVAHCWDIYKGIGWDSADLAYQYDAEYFCINALDGKARKDSNVTSFRNILVEFDKLTPEAQLHELAMVPYATLVWSGNKSYHAIISLEEPCATREEYAALVRRIQAKLPDMDKATSNPARLSRTPGAERSNGQVQKLISVRGRVSRAVVEEWLGPAPVEPIKVRGDADDKKRYRILAPSTNYYLAFGESDNRNKQLFLIACDMLRAGYDVDQITEKVSAISSLPQKEIYATIRSANKTVNRE